MLLIARLGAFASSVSRRVNITALAGSAFAFFEMNRRPVVVEAHNVELSAEVRLIQPTEPPLRVAPYVHVFVVVVAHVSRPFVDASPSCTQSPHCTVKSPVNSLQCWSR